MNVNYADSMNINVTFNNQAEMLMLNNGFDHLSQDDKNSALVLMAIKKNMAISDITADIILAYHKELKINQLRQQCLDAISAGYTSSNGHTYRTNSDDQINMIGKRIEIMDDPTITTVMWRQEDINDWVSHSVSDWLTYVWKEAGKNKETQEQKFNSLKKNVSDATDSTGIIAVKWS